MQGNLIRCRIKFDPHSGYSVAIIPQALNVPYLGLLDLPLRRFLASMPTGFWSWSPSSLYACWNQGHFGTSWDGIRGWTVDVNKGLTQFDAGVVPTGADGNWISWASGSMGAYGPVMSGHGASNAGTALNKGECDFPLDGGSHSGLPWTPTLLVNIPAGSNTQYPGVAWNGGFASDGLAGGIITPVIGLVITNYDYQSGVAFVPQAGFPAGSSLNTITCVAPIGGGLWSMRVTSSAAGTPMRANITSFKTNFTQYTPLTFQSPDGVFDVTTWLNSSGVVNMQQSAGGLLGITIAALVLNGQAVNGLGILILPDFSGYFLFTITPKDAPSALWRTLGGVTIAADRFGTIFFRTNNNLGQMLYGSLQPQIAIPVPIGQIPIIPIPHFNGYYR